MCTFLRFAIVGLHKDEEYRVPRSRTDLKVLFVSKGTETSIQDEEASRLMKGLPQFCFPESKEKLTKLMGCAQLVQYFPIVLTTGNGTRVHGFCLRTRRLGRGHRHDFSWRFPICFVIFSMNPYHRIFRSVLSILATTAWRDGQAGLKTKLAKLRRCSSLKHRHPGVAVDILSHRMRIPHAADPPDPRLAPLLERFESEALLKLMGSMLSERRVLFHGEGFISAAGCVIGAIALIYPFEWQHVLVPVVPDHIRELVLTPMPFILGMTTSQLQTIKAEYGESMGTIVFADVDAGTVEVMRVGRERGSRPRTSSMDTIPALDTKMPKTILKRFKHGAFNCVRLRRDLRAIRSDARSSQQVKGKRVVGEHVGHKQQSAQESVMGIMKGMEHRMGIYRDVIGVLDETKIRTSCLAFFVRVFANCDKFVKDGVTSSGKSYMLDMDAFVTSVPDPGVRELLRSMKNSQLLERFVQRFMAFCHGKNRAASLTWFMTARQHFKASLSWSETKEIVLMSLQAARSEREGPSRRSSPSRFRTTQQRSPSETSSVFKKKNEAMQTKSRKIAKDLQSALLRLTSNQSIEDDEGQSVHEDENGQKTPSALLEDVRLATFDDAIYRNVWPILEMRLADCGGHNWRHAVKALAIIRHLLLNGSPRFFTDLHARLGAKVVRTLLNHENCNVKRQAILIYRLSNDNRFLQWASHWRPMTVLDVSRQSISSGVTFAEFHRRVASGMPLLSNMRRQSSEQLLDLFDDEDMSRTAESKQVRSVASTDDTLLSVFGVTESSTIINSKNSSTPASRNDPTDFFDDLFGTKSSTTESGSRNHTETATHVRREKQQEEKQEFDLFGDFMDGGDASNDVAQDTAADDSFLDFDDDDFAESLPIINA